MWTWFAQFTVDGSAYGLPLDVALAQRPEWRPSTPLPTPSEETIRTERARTAQLASIADKESAWDSWLWLAPLAAVVFPPLLAAPVVLAARNIVTGDLTASTRELAKQAVDEAVKTVESVTESVTGGMSKMMGSVLPLVAAVVGAYLLLGRN